MAEANKQLVHRLHSEVVAGRDLDRLGEFFSERFASHNLPPGLPPGIDGVRLFFAAFGEALEDLEVTVDVLLGEGDLVAVRTTTRGRQVAPLLGLPGDGQEVAIDGVDIVRIEDGLIVEHWGLTNLPR